MATGNLLARFGAASNQPPAAGYATPDLRNGLLVLDFDAAAEEAAIFVDVLPPLYSGGGLTVKIRWMASTASSGQTQWKVTIERHQRGVDDSDVDSFSGPAYAATAPPALVGSEVESVVALTAGAGMDNLAVGERFRLKVARDATNGSDTMAGDAELVQVDILET